MLSKSFLLAMVAHDYNHSMRKAEAVRAPQVQNQPGLHNETLPQNTK